MQNYFNLAHTVKFVLQIVIEGMSVENKAFVLFEFN